MQTGGLKQTFYKLGFSLKKKSPEIFVIAGVVGTVVSTVLACRATLKAKPVLEEHKANIESTHKAYEELSDENVEENYISENEQKDITKIYTQTTLKIISLYAPAVALGALSITGILTSHHILQKRNVALAAAYATLDRGFKSYRERVIDKYGEEADKDLLYGGTIEKIETEIVDENGKKKKVKEEVYVIDPKLSSNPYARLYGRYIFDEDGNLVFNNHWESGGMDWNISFLNAQERYWNDMLKIKDRVFLNDVYKDLGLPITHSGQVVGWEYRPKDEDHVGDNFIDFGDMRKVKVAVNSGGEEWLEDFILLDFNVDGEIWSNM